MQRLVVVGTAMLAFGCAPAASPGASEQTIVREEQMRNDARELTALKPGITAALAPLGVPAARAWSLLPSAYSVLSIPTTSIDSVNRIVGGKISARRQFAGRPMESLVDCGSSLTGPNAATFAVTITLKTQVQAPTPETSSLYTLMDASGTNMGGTTLRCSSTGQLEKAILDRVRTGLVN